MPCRNVRHRYCWFPRGGFERLEPYDGKLSRTVLRGAWGLVTVLWAGNGPRLPGRPFSRNRASIGAVQIHVVNGDRGPRSPNFIAMAMGSSEIGAVRGVFVGEK